MEFQIVLRMETLGPKLSQSVADGSAALKCTLVGKYCTHVPARLLMITYVCTALWICHIDLEMRFVRQSLVRDVINVPAKVDDMVTISLGNLNLGHKEGHKSF